MLQLVMSISGEWRRDLSHSVEKVKKVEIKKVFEGVKGIRGRHVGLYLLRNCANAYRVMYYCRAVPREMLADLLDNFDQELKEAVEEVVGLTLKENQWVQATLPIKGGGLGIEGGKRGWRVQLPQRLEGRRRRRAKTLTRGMCGTERTGCRDWGKLWGGWRWTPRS